MPNKAYHALFALRRCGYLAVSNLSIAGTFPEFLATLKANFVESHIAHVCDLGPLNEINYSAKIRPNLSAEIEDLTFFQ